MARIEQNKEFLESLVISVGKKRSKIILNSTEEEIKCCFEIILNSPNLKYTKTEDKEFKKCVKFIKQFYSSKWNLSEIKAFIVKNASKFQILTALVFSKFIQGEICSLMQNGMQPSNLKSGPN